MRHRIFLRAVWTSVLFRLAIAYGILAVVTASARAELVWTSQTEHREVLGKPAAVSFEFDCRNEGESYVWIIAVQPSCDCLEVTESTSVIPSGAAGRIRATYRIGSRVGRQEAHLQVMTSDRPDRPILLDVAHRN